MKIGIVLYPTYGGSGVVATELGKELVKRGHEIHFISYKRPARLSHFIENVYFHEVAVANYPLFKYKPYESALTAKIVDVATNEQLDVLHVHYAIPHASAGYLAKQILASKGIHIPMVTTLHGTDITIVGRDPSLKPVVEFSINQSDAVTTVSNSLKQQTYDYFDVEADIEVIYNFIDTSKFADQNKQHFKKAIAPNGEKILCHISNFRKVKRIDDIIRGFHLLNQEIPSKLLLVGDGPERFDMEQLCRDLGIESDVTFLGRQDAIEEILAIADVFVMASEKESFGLSALEALASGVPVISSNAGGLPELNVHGETGFVFEIGNIEQLAQHLKTFFKDDILQGSMSRDAYLRAQDFSVEAIIPKYEAIYERVLQKK